MRSFRFFVSVALCTSALLMCQSVEDQPGYRTETPIQVVDVNHVYMAPSGTRFGNFTFNDTNATLSSCVGNWSAGEVGIMAGVRNIELGLGSRIHCKDTLYGVLGAQVKYQGLERWEWLANAMVQADVRKVNFLQRARYIAGLNGRYDFSERIGLYVGFYAELGMRASIVHPLIGADYTLGNWVFSAIYPVKAGVSYKGVKNSLFSLMVRPFYTAVKVDRGPYHRPSIAVYDGTGAEFRWDWQQSSACLLWASIGHTINGNLSIGNGSNRHRHSVHLERVPYLQLGVTIGL